MRFPVKNSQTSVEISHYKSMEKGALLGFFTLIEYNEDCPLGRRIVGCKLFGKDGRRWIGFPDKEAPAKSPGEKSTFYPYVSFVDKDFQTRLCDAAMQAISAEQRETKAPQENFNW